MKHLLDVNVLLAAIWSNHSRHTEAFAWWQDRYIAAVPAHQPTLRPALVPSDAQVAPPKTRTWRGGSDSVSAASSAPMDSSDIHSDYQEADISDISL